MENRQTEPVYEFGPFRLSVAERRLLRDGQVVSLPSKAFDTLAALVEHNGRLVEKGELMTRLWPDAFVEEATLAHNISDLRKVLGEAPGAHKYIETVPRHGYRFVAPVRRLPEEPATLVVERHARQRIVAEVADETATATRAGRSKPARWRVRPALLLAVAVLVLAMVLVYRWLPMRKTTVPLTAVRSMAVLPFQPMGEQESDEYLELGMADALITRLANLQQIIVRPTGSVLKYNKPDQDMSAAGRELGVEALLAGRVQRAGDRVRVTVQLIRVADGTPLWADRFDTQFTDIFTVQDSIAAQVTRALALNLTGAEQQRLAKHDTEDAEAYQLYLKGRFFWNKRSEEGLKKGIEYFNQAIGVDPGYALAYVGLADSYTVLGSLSLAPPGEAFPKARAAAARALAIDEQLAEAHASLAYVTHLYDWEWPGPEPGFKRAIELKPNWASAHQWYALSLAARGRLEEAIAEAQRAQEVDPLALNINATVGWVYYLARQYDRAIEQCQKTLELDQNFTLAHIFLGMAYEQQGRYEEAIAAFQRAREIAGGMPKVLGALGHAYARAGKRAEARQVLDEAKQLAQQRYFPPFYIALIYTGMGERQQAIERLEQAYAERYPWLIQLDVEPRLDPLRSDPRFRDLRRRVGLPPS